MRGRGITGGRGITAIGAATALAATAAVGICGATAASPKPAKTVKGAIMKPRAGTLKQGTKLSGSALNGTRVFVNAKAGWKLAAGKGAQYAAATTNGGKTWRTASPALHINAANAPLAVTQIGAVSPKVAYAFGSGQVADVTSDAGKHWYSALFQGTVMAVVPGIGKQLVAFVDGFAPSHTFQYVSKNGGKTWKLTPGS